MFNEPLNTITEENKTNRNVSDANSISSRLSFWSQVEILFVGFIDLKQL
jgi:hypothetical protein